MKIFKRLFFIFTILSLVVISAFVGYSLAYTNLILPNITISGVKVGGLDRDTAIKYLEREREQKPVKLVYKIADKSYENIDSVAVVPDVPWAVDQAISVGRGTNILVNVWDRFERINKTRNIEIPLQFDVSNLDDVAEQIANSVEIAPIWPKLMEVNGEIVVKEGKNGVQVKRDVLKKDVLSALSRFGNQDIYIPTVVIDTSINKEQIQKRISLLSSWEGNELIVKYKEFSKRIIKREALSLVGLKDEEVDSIEFEKLTKEVKEAMEIESKDANFVFENGRVQEFQPEVTGVKVDVESFRNRLSEIIFKSQDRNLEVPVILDYPKIRTGDINNMGIRELIGVGKSSFAHSIPGRIFNVNLASSRISGVVVPPGEEFSFNKAVGEISRATGYQTAYVISEGRTVLGDGGGVCQVSTTAFRAALNFGFPITERKAHAYRVGYYEQDSEPGIDATIFSPSTDFKFLNDTGHHILIQTKVDTKNLKMSVEIYGTHDGRVSTVSKPKISSQSSPPATVYVDDPTLPKGQLKQIDWSAYGAKVSFDYKVQRGGEDLFQKTFFSNYQPWRAVYLRGTGG